MKNIKLLCALIATSASVFASEKQIHSFETAEVPAWLSGEDQQWSWTSEKFQHGEQSLVWSWQNREGFEVDARPFAQGEQSPTDFMVWVYSKEPNGALDISWGEGQQVRYELNFTGWRSLWIRLNFDGMPASRNHSEWDHFRVNGMGRDVDQYQTEVSTIKIRPTAQSGELFFDMMEITDQAIPHDRVGNIQMPYILNDPTLRHNYPWVAYSFERQGTLPATNSENLASYESITASIEDIYKPRSMGRLGRAQKGYKDFMSKVVVTDEGIIGPHISTHIVERYYRQNGREGIHIHTMHGALLYAAHEYDKTKDPEWKDFYFKALDFQYEKGFAEGSGMMNLVFAAKNAENYIASLLIMRPQFDDERWAREAATLRWICGYNNLYNPEQERVDADKMLGDMKSLLIAIYLQPEVTDEQKMSKLYDYMQLSNVIQLTMEPGVPDGDGFRIVMPDWSIYHHGMENIFGYGYVAAKSYFNFAYVFRDGPAAFEDDTMVGLMELYPKLITNKGHLPIMSARGAGPSVFRTYESMLNVAAALGLDVAQEWLKAYHRNGVITSKGLRFDNKAKVIDNPAVKAAEPLEGNWVQPYAAVLSHRRDDWMAIMHGVNRMTPSPEMFSNPESENCANVYGDQQGNGFLQLIQNEGVKHSGFDLNAGGWDWSMYPGATTMKVSLEVLKNNASGAVRPKERVLSGGLSHFENDGLYHQRLFANSDSIFDGVDGFKSYFFFDDVVVCLGAGLNSPEAVDAPMVTTLFQTRHRKDQPALGVKFAKLSVQLREGVTEEIDSQDLLVMDPMGHVYYVPKQDTLKVRRGVQHSAGHRRPFPPNEAYFSKAWLDHGANITDGSYEYAIKILGGEKALGQFNANEIYTVLRNDSDAQIVHHLGKDSYGYAFISATSQNEHGPVIATDKPVLSMATIKEDGLALTLSDPDPAINEPERTVSHKLVVKGEWSNLQADDPDSVSHKIVGGNTVIDVKIKDGWPVDIMLGR